MENTPLFPSKGRPFDPVNIAFLVITPLVAVFGTSWYVYQNGVTWLEIANFVLMFILTGMSVTGGYHRYFAHRTYDSSKALQLFYAIFGAAAVENSILSWASDHRLHHKFVDTDDDPYNILRGGLYAHMGWIFFKDTRAKATKFKTVPDLLKNPIVVWQHRWYLPLVIGISFGLPTCIGMIQGRPFGGLLWGGFLRVVIVHHMTFFVNSIAHLYGTRPYSEDNTARDNWLVAPLTFGEGYHNFHHAFPADHRNGIRWYQFDMTKWWLWTCEAAGLAWNLRKVPESAILLAKLRVQMLHLERRWAEAGAPSTLWERVQTRVHRGRERVEAAMHQYYVAKAEYRRQKEQWSSDLRRDFRRNLAQYREEFDEAMEGWRQTLRAMNRYPRPSAQSLLTLGAILDVFRMRGGL